MNINQNSSNAKSGEEKEQISTANEDQIGLSVTPSSDTTYPLSLIQEGVWIASQLNPDGIFNNNVAILRIVGPLSVERLLRAIDAVQVNHSALRTRLSTAGGAPVQEIVESLEKANVIDLSINGDNPGLEGTALQIARNAASSKMQIDAGSLFRAQLTKVSPELSYLTLTIHHIISDGWSWGPLLNTLAAEYMGHKQASPPRTYRDFVVEQRNEADTPGYQDAISYWKLKLDGVSKALDIPTSQPRTARLGNAGARFNFALDAKLDALLKENVKSKKRSAFSVFAAALALTMREVGAGNDIPIAAPIANRLHQDWEQTVGLFVNTVLLRLKIEENENYEAFADLAHRSVMEALQYQNVPLETLRPLLNISGSPIQVMLVSNNAAIRNTQFENLSVKWIDQEIHEAKCELTLYFWEETGRTVFYWEYNSDLYDHDLITRITEIFFKNLGCITQTSSQDVAKVNTDAALKDVKHYRLALQSQSGYRSLAPNELVKRRSEVPAIASIDDWTWRPSWERIALGGKLSEISEETILLFRPEGLLGDTLRSSISATCAQLIDIVPGKQFAISGNDVTLNPVSDADYKEFVEFLKQSNTVPDRIVFALPLSSTTNCSAIDAGHVTEQLDLGVIGVLTMARHLSRIEGLRHVPVFVLSAGLAKAVDGIADPTHGSLIGALVAMGQETREFSPTLINLPVNEPAQRVVAPVIEIMRSIDSPEILAVNRTREVFALRHVPYKFPQDVLVKAGHESFVRPGGRYVIAGGKSGIGHALAKQMVSNGAGSVLVLGRSAPDQSEVSSLLALGAAVEYLQIDINSKADMETLADRLSSTKQSIDAIFNLANVLHSGMLLRTDNSTAKRGLMPKVAGTLNLVNLARQTNARTLVLFSSVSGTLGGVGTGVYSAACSFQDVLADAWEDQGLQIKTVDWGPWRDVGLLRQTDVPADHREAHLRTLEQAMPTGKAFIVLERLMASTSRRLMVVAQSYDDLWKVGRAKDGSGNSEAGEGPNHLASVDVQNLIKSAWADVLGVQEIDPSDDFFEDLGGHSLLAFQAVEIAGTRLKKEIPLPLLFDNPKLNDFCNAVSRYADSGVR